MRARLFCFLLFLSISSLSVKAQSDTSSLASNKNAISFSLAYFDFPKIEKLFSFTRRFAGSQVADQFGIYYSRQVHPLFRVSAGFSAWNSIPWLTNRRYGKDGYYILHGGPIAYHTNDLIYYFKYHMVDLVGMYRFSSFRRHRLDIGAGLSYAWGRNCYVGTAIQGAPWEFLLHTYTKNVGYFGYLGVASYNYQLFDDKMSVGADLKLRKYRGIYSSEVDYCFHISYNF